MRVKNKHGRVEVKTPLSHTQRRVVRLEGYREGFNDAKVVFLNSVRGARSLRELKKELGL